MTRTDTADPSVKRATSASAGAACCAPARKVAETENGPDPYLPDFHQALKAFLKVFQFRDRDRICCFDVSVTQSYALDALVESGALTQNQLSAALYLDKSTTSRVIATLERKGYVRRKAHPEDRRAVAVELTAAGRKMHAAIEASLMQQQARMLATVPDALRRQTLDVLRQMTATASAGVSTAGGVCCVLE